ncbi:MAG TPA: hypothetical protein VKZ53_27770 [Candidatus Angelobacter sp.]|nr:hypothetical protein [Candidatus Angelobacter sp.]
METTRIQAQFVLGHAGAANVESGQRRLPNVAELFPEIINEELDARDKQPSCSALEALEQQSPFINQALAYPALAMLAQFFRKGRLSYHGGFLNVKSGRLSSLPVSPAVRPGITAR